MDAGNRNLACEFHAAARDRLDDPFLIDARGTWTHGAFYDRVRAYAAVLAEGR